MSEYQGVAFRAIENLCDKFHDLLRIDAPRLPSAHCGRRFSSDCRVAKRSRSS